MAKEKWSKALKDFSADLSAYEELYKFLHSHPELSLQEENTAKKAVEHLKDLKVFDIHEHIGGHGVAAVFRNGPGKTVLLRADMDALPVLEKTDLPYASKVVMKDVADGLEKPVMHACAHDMHVTCLLAAAEFLVKNREDWSGTLILVFQPNEERAMGAKAMVLDGLYDKVPVPDLCLGQHVFPLRAGTIHMRNGSMMAASNSMKITLFGRGGHGSMPDKSVDPVVMAANVVVRLQTIVSRELDPNQTAVITVGSLQAGQTENVIPEIAEIRLNVRTLTDATRTKVLAAIRRIVKAECAASNAPKEPLFEDTSTFPLTLNDENLKTSVGATFQDFFGEAYDGDMPQCNGSEDFTELGSALSKPCLFWFVGGVDKKLWDAAHTEGTHESIPVNHSSYFAPVIQPTLSSGMQALSIGALTFLGHSD